MDRGAWKASPQGCKESDTTEATQHACRHKTYVYNQYVTEFRHIPQYTNIQKLPSNIQVETIQFEKRYIILPTRTFSYEFYEDETLIEKSIEPKFCGDNDR